MDMGANLFDPAKREFIIFNSYLGIAILYQDNIYALTAYGTIQKYTVDGRIIDTPIPPSVIRKFWDVSKKYAK